MLGLNLGSKIWMRVRNMFIWAAFLLTTSFAMSLYLYDFEKNNPGHQLNSFRELWWWWLNTVTGLGSPYEPISTTGRLIASLIIFSGFVLLGLFISEFSEILRMIYSRRDEGNIKIGYRRHVVIFGYTSLTAGVIKLIRNTFGKDLRIVLISNDVDTNPFPGQVDFISDNPISYSTLQDANVSEALAAIILANDRFRDPDTYSLVIASGIERTNTKVTTIVELVDHSTKDLFKKTNTDGFIDRRELLNDLLDKNPQPKLLRIILKESNLSERQGPAVDTDLL